MLTNHQLKHVSAIIADTESTQRLSSTDRESLVTEKGVDSADVDDYLASVLADAQNIIDTETFPSLDEDSDIHDHVEITMQPDYISPLSP